MALIYQTTMSPSKLELLAAWLPTQPWFAGDVASLTRLGGYRLDDPAGEVGLEGHILTAGDDTVYHVPLSYRGAPLESGERFLLGTAEHGVLGTRWFSNAVGDPVYRSVLAQTIAQGGREADEVGVGPDGEAQERKILIRVRGSGEPGAAVPDLTVAQVGLEGAVSVVESEEATLTVRRVLDADYVEPFGSLTLRVTWPGQVLPVVAATLTV